MIRVRAILIAIGIAVSGLGLTALGAKASAFFAWSITDVPPGDTLNVRAWPSSQSQILVAYPNGHVLSMTGKCTKGVNLGAVAGQPVWQQKSAVRYAWCETWIDPQGTGQFRSGWVYGRYITPQ